MEATCFRPNSAHNESCDYPQNCCCMAYLCTSGSGTLVRSVEAGVWLWQCPFHSQTSQRTFPGKRNTDCFWIPLPDPPLGHGPLGSQPPWVAHYGQGTRSHAPLLENEWKEKHALLWSSFVFALSLFAYKGLCWLFWGLQVCRPEGWTYESLTLSLTMTRSAGVERHHSWIWQPGRIEVAFILAQCWPLNSNHLFAADSFELCSILNCTDFFAECRWNFRVLFELCRFRSKLIRITRVYRCTCTFWRFQSADAFSQGSTCPLAWCNMSRHHGYRLCSNPRKGTCSHYVTGGDPETTLDDVTWSPQNALWENTNKVKGMSSPEFQSKNSKVQKTQRHGKATKSSKTLIELWLNALKIWD